MQDQLVKLQHFTDNVLREASRESQALNREMEERRNSTIHGARLAAWQSAKAYYEKEAAAIRTQAGRELSRHMMEGTRQVYRRRSEIAQEVTGKVLERIRTFVTTPEYPECLKATLGRVMGRLEKDGVDEIVLRLRRDDLPLGPMLAESVAPVKVTVQESRIKYGGLNVRCPKLGIRVDCSFDAQLEEMSSHFAEMFGLSISDEPEQKREGQADGRV